MTRPHNIEGIHQRTDEGLRAELTRIHSSGKPAGAVFGVGYVNYGYAARILEQELQWRSEQRAVPSAKSAPAPQTSPAEPAMSDAEIRAAWAGARELNAERIRREAAPALLIAQVSGSAAYTRPLPHRIIY